MLWKTPCTIISALPPDAGNIALIFLLLIINWYTVSSVQYLNHEVNIICLPWSIDKNANSPIKVTEPNIQNSYISVY